MKKLVCFLSPTEFRVSESVNPSTGEVITDSQGNALMAKTYRLRTKEKVGVRNSETGRVSARFIEPILLADESVEELVGSTPKKELTDVLFYERDEDGNRLFSPDGGYVTKKVKAFAIEVFVSTAQREIEGGMRSFYSASLTDSSVEVLFETSLDENGQYQLSSPSESVPVMEVAQPEVTEVQEDTPSDAPTKEQLLETIKSMQALGLDIPQELVLQLASAK